MLARFVRTYGAKFAPAEADLAAVEKDWHEALEDVPDDIGLEAVAEVRRTCKFPPTPADVIEAARKYGYTEPDDNEKYWAALRRIRNDKSLSKEERGRRIRARFGRFGSAVHLGLPDDPPFPWETEKWAALGIVQPTEEHAA